MPPAGTAPSERATRETYEHEREGLLARETAAREQAQRMNDSKDNFLAMLGHELRNRAHAADRMAPHALLAVHLTEHVVKQDIG